MWCSRNQAKAYGVFLTGRKTLRCLELRVEQAPVALHDAVLAHGKQLEIPSGPEEICRTAPPEPPLFLWLKQVQSKLPRRATAPGIFASIGEPLKPSSKVNWVPCAAVPGRCPFVSRIVLDARRLLLPSSKRDSHPRVLLVLGLGMQRCCHTARAANRERQARGRGVDLQVAESDGAKDFGGLVTRHRQPAVAQLLPYDALRRAEATQQCGRGYRSHTKVLLSRLPPGQVID
jgi:hypothetical protein